MALCVYGLRRYMMKVVMPLLAVLGTGMLALAQTGRESQAGAPATPKPPQIIGLPLKRESGPPILFGRAARDGRGECRVHHSPLTAAVVPIAYGLLPGLGRDYYAAEREHFPNAMTRYEGGCLVMAAKEAKVLHCQRCLAAKKAWEAKQSR